MHGYAATARIEHVQPHRVEVAGLYAPPAAATSALLDTRPVEEILGRPFGERWAAWWSTVRVTWQQTTFFLFDSDSWR